MTSEASPYTPENTGNTPEDTGTKVWNKILQASLALPGTKVHRNSFLRSQLTSYCAQTQVQKAIDTSPAVAGIPEEVIDKIADACIKQQVLIASSLSFTAGLPGGWFMAATVPADLAQFYGNVIVLAQKLAYLYGWPDLLEGDEVDEQTKWQLTLLIGSMMGANLAQRGLMEVAERLAVQVAHRLPREALTKYAVYNLAKQTARWIGISITKTSFSRGISKAIPVIGAVASAGITAGMMWPMARRLQRHLKTLKFAKPELET